MVIPDWNAERTKLQTRFSTGNITVATRKELERYLVVLANTMQFQGMPDTAQKLQHERDTGAFDVIIRHLLMIRLGEELHAKSHKISVLALVVAVAAAVFAAGAVLFAGLQWWADVQKSHAAVLPASAASGASQTLSPLQPLSGSSIKSKSPSPSKQFVPYIAATNSTPVPSTVSTKR